MEHTKVFNSLPPFFSLSLPLSLSSLAVLLNNDFSPYLFWRESRIFLYVTAPKFDYPPLCDKSLSIN
jgi:hypothetical protein